MASVPQRLCSVVSVRTYLGRVQMVLRPTGAVPGVCGSGPRGCADGSCLIVDSMAVVIYESAPVVVAGCDQVLFRVVNLPVAEGLFQKQVRLHPKIIVFKIQCIIKFATIVIYDHLMGQSGLKYDNLDRYVLHTAILSPLILLIFVFGSALVTCTHVCISPLFLLKRSHSGASSYLRIQWGARFVLTIAAASFLRGGVYAEMVYEGRTACGFSQKKVSAAGRCCAARLLLSGCSGCGGGGYRYAG